MVEVKGERGWGGDIGDIGCPFEALFPIDPINCREANTSGPGIICHSQSSPSFLDVQIAEPVRYRGTWNWLHLTIHAKTLFSVLVWWPHVIIWVFLPWPRLSVISFYHGTSQLFAYCFGPSFGDVLEWAYCLLSHYKQMATVLLFSWCMPLKPCILVKWGNFCILLPTYWISENFIGMLSLGSFWFSSPCDKSILEVPSFNQVIIIVLVIS